MTEHPEPGGGGETSAAVAGLARELEALRRQVDALVEVPARVEQLAHVAAGLADQLAAYTDRAAPGTAPSWLDLPADVGIAREVVTQLVAWMARVFLRYPDAAGSLPDCWLWHPDVIEELLWLMHAWLAAYSDDSACVALVGDWHDRYRPGVVRRITAAAGRCSLENHQDRRHDAGPPVVPVAIAAVDIATWWGTGSDSSAPEPTEAHLTAAEVRHRPGTRR